MSFTIRDPRISLQPFGTKSESEEEEEETGTTVFYQWITFVLAIHAAMLRFPYMIWKAQEDGYMKSFYADGQGKSIENKVRIFYKIYKLN